MLGDGRLVETVKHTHKGTSFTNQQWQWAPEVNKGTFDAKRNVDSQCRIVLMSKKKQMRINTRRKSDVCQKYRCRHGHVFVVLFTRKVVTCSVVY